MQLCTQLKIMKALEDDTDYKMKTAKETEHALTDVDPMRENLKDRQHGNEYIAEFEEGRKKMEQYIKALEKEIAKRRQVVDLLTQGKKYYESLHGEAEIVATVSCRFPH
jgi:protein associated with RNAse G/E